MISKNVYWNSSNKAIILEAAAAGDNEVIEHYKHWMDWSIEPGVVLDVIVAALNNRHLDTAQLLYRDGNPESALGHAFSSHHKEAMTALFTSRAIVVNGLEDVEKFIAKAKNSPCNQEDMNHLAKLLRVEHPPQIHNEYLVDSQELGASELVGILSQDVDAQSY